MQINVPFKLMSVWSHFKARHIIAVIIALLVGAAFTWYAYQSEDKEMRANLTVYAKTIEQSINWTALVSALNGSAAPDKIPEEKLAVIKQQMRNACNANKQCHFIYLLYGERRQVKFLLDASDQPASEISQMGELFYDASNALRIAVKERQALVEGPVTDHWGTWVSTFVPVTPTLNEPHFVLMGVDVAVVGWNKRLLKNIMLPITITLVALLAIFILVYQNANKEWRLAQMFDVTLSLEHKANVDALTGLPNRNLLDVRMGQLFARADRTESLVAVLYLDLDRFKEVNDSYGHAVGDQLLVRASERLTSLMGEHDVVARIGGDEFIILLADLADEQSALDMAQALVDSLTMPFDLDDKELQLGASIGMAFYPIQNTDAYRLIHDADIAMYQAKRQGRNRYVVYDASMEAVFK